MTDQERVLRIRQAVALAFGAAGIVASRYPLPDEATIKSLMLEPAAFASTHLAPLLPLSAAELTVLLRDVLVASAIAAQTAATAGAISSAVNAATKAHGE